MTFSGTERRRQLVTAGIGTALTLVMGAVLIMGFRLATHMRASINALQTASALKPIPRKSRASSTRCATASRCGPTPARRSPTCRAR